MECSLPRHLSHGSLWFLSNSWKRKPRTGAWATNSRTEHISLLLCPKSKVDMSINRGIHLGIFPMKCFVWTYWMAFFLMLRGVTVWIVLFELALLDGVWTCFLFAKYFNAFIFGCLHMSKTSEKDLNTSHLIPLSGAGSSPTWKHVLFAIISSLLDGIHALFAVELLGKMRKPCLKSKLQTWMLTQLST